MSNVPLFDAVQSPLHTEWRADRELHRRVPLGHAWRGCLGLAALIDRQDDTQYHGDAALVRNDQLRWIAMRDVPPGRFPTAPAMDRRDVCYANTAVAELRHGLPAIDFTRDVRDAVDFRFFPFGTARRRLDRWSDRPLVAVGDVLNSDDRPREFAVFNRVSGAMTRFAFAGLDTRRRRPVRRAWFERRPTAGFEPYTVPEPAAFMPRPYLAFPRDAAAHLVDLATRGKAADGPEVGFAPAFQQAFCAAVCDGLPLTSVGPATYLGSDGGNAGRDEADRGRRPGLIGHRFRSEVDGRPYVVRLPRSARVSIRSGEALEPGAVWCRVLPPSPEWWRREHRHRRWAALPEVLGGRPAVAAALRLWLEHRAVRLVSDPDLLLYPAELVSPFVRDVRPVGLWWDLHPSDKYVDSLLEAIVLPPLRLRDWDGLRLALPGDVDLNASIADPRLRVRLASPKPARWFTPEVDPDSVRNPRRPVRAVA